MIPSHIDLCSISKSKTITFLRRYACFKNSLLSKAVSTHWQKAIWTSPKERNILCTIFLSVMHCCYLLLDQCSVFWLLSNTEHYISYFLQVWCKIDTIHTLHTYPIQHQLVAMLVSVLFASIVLSLWIYSCRCSRVNYIIGI